jgi:hypothetical protein
MGTSPQTGLPIATQQIRGRVVPPTAKVVNLSSQPQQLNPGDQINSGDPGGWWVVLKGHFGPASALRPGDSNDLVHWSVGSSPAGGY